MRDLQTVDPMVLSLTLMPVLASLGLSSKPREREVWLIRAFKRLYEPVLIHRAAPPHPYWPGGAVLLDGEREPRAVGLLDGLSAAALH